MKRKLILSLMASGTLSCMAGVEFDSGTLDQTVPDNNPDGYANTINVSGLGSSLEDVTVQLNISGGYNGDLYAYLTYDRQTVTLLNLVGTGGGSTYGYSDTGFNITLSDGGTSGLHNYQANGGMVNVNGQLTGTWQPDSGGVSFGSTYGGVDPNGQWSLFVADLSPGSQSMLVSWDLNITAVPEPVNAALGIFGGLMGVLVLWRARQKFGKQKS